MLEIQVVRKAQAHLEVATKARSYYKGQIEDAKRALKATFMVDGVLTPPSISACLPPKAHDITMHFSFDMAQQVHTISIRS